ncbi:Hypothetical predicted protein, partial [Mytilus galloprovincialis]
VQIKTNVSTQTNDWVSAWYTADIMNYTIDINKCNLDLNGITSLVFEIKTCREAQVHLSSSDVRNSSEPLYAIVIGQIFFYINYRANDSVESTNTEFFQDQNLINCTVDLPLWTSWADGEIKLGSGNVVGENVLGNLTNTHPFEVKSIGVLTYPFTLGKWKIQLE